jgi:hypothetical protein
MEAFVMQNLNLPHRTDQHRAVENLAQMLAAMRELKDFITHPRVVPLVNAAFDAELRWCRNMAESVGLAAEFEQALRKKPPMH